MKKVLIIGAGAMGAAFSFPLVDNNHKVTLTEPYNKDFQNKLLKNTELQLGKVKYNDKILHQSKIIKFYIESTSLSFVSIVRHCIVYP